MLEGGAGEADSYLSEGCVKINTATQPAPPHVSLSSTFISHFAPRHNYSSNVYYDSCAILPESSRNVKLHDRRSEEEGRLGEENICREEGGGRERERQEQEKH